MALDQRQSSLTCVRRFHNWLMHFQTVFKAEIKAIRFGACAHSEAQSRSDDIYVCVL